MSRQPLDFQALLDASHDDIDAAQEACDLLKLRADESGDLDDMTTWATLTAQIQAARFSAIHAEVFVKNALQAEHVARAQAANLIQSAGGNGGPIR
ncbi:hypothetical protein HN371_29265 [Candidatus Poribacteria bacterium]|jgi:hypothetical protein|nr:hypothetical protein [Candidatus Poribacteria bacterium]MBT5533500.1 hypothetical protein [Candidatus Poribacteria bacterium]MBT5710130.1 hypothetical protein [Candidatus Poribacteria bacterium]MBT7100535.1 hypothetical protein [Candidatus Poribacteria bacterium]MBT7808897.1 hypothetical protein [Candidatus Poribacteria bacterium]